MRMKIKKATINLFTNKNYKIKMLIVLINAISYRKMIKIKY